MGFLQLFAFFKRVELLQSFVYDSFFVRLLQSNQVLSFLVFPRLRMHWMGNCFSPLCWKCWGVVLLSKAKKGNFMDQTEQIFFMIPGILKSSQIKNAIDYSFKCKHNTFNCFFQLYELWSLGLPQIFIFLLFPGDSQFILKPSCRISVLDQHSGVSDECKEIG